MNQRTIATLEKLRKAAWFASVGIQDTEDALVLNSWEEAVQHCSSLDWENICLEALNQYRARLLERSKSRFMMWSEILSEVKPIAIKLVEQKTSSLLSIQKLPTVFLDTVNWDITGVLMEAEYADVFPPGFYASQAYWYVKGHFPCGWQGDFSQGRIIVF